MATSSLYLVRRTDRSRRAQLIDGIHTVLLTTETVGAPYIAAEAQQRAVAAGHNLPADYFNSVDYLGDPIGGALAADQDAVVILPDSAEWMEGP